MLFEESVFIFQFLNNKMHNYVLFNTFVHFIIQKLKNKHTFLKTEKAKFSLRETFIQTEKAKSSHFDRMRGDKNQIFPTLDMDYKLVLCFGCFLENIVQIKQ